MTTATQAEFARLMGVNRSTVTRTWKQAGRLVMDGDLVDVEASRARIKATADPTRVDVAERHAEYRGQEVGAGDTAPAVDPTPRSPSAAPSAPDAVGNSYQAARAVKEKYAALKAKADYEQQIAHLIPREDVDAAMRHLGAAVRSAMDVFPDQTAPLVAPVTSMDEVHSLLSEACRSVLEGIDHALARQQAALAGGSSAS
jgi:hypothetical protein